MKDNIKRLMMIFKIFGPDHFYCYKATNYGVLCMCRFNPGVLIKALDHKFILTTCSNGFLDLKRGPYTITITD